MSWNEGNLRLDAAEGGRVYVGDYDILDLARRIDDLNATLDFPQASQDGWLQRSWRINLGDRTYSNLVVDADGVLYLALLDGSVLALSAIGHVRWRLRLESPSYGAVVMMDNKNLLLGTDSGRVYALDHAGHVNWMFDTGGVPVRSGIVINTAQDTVFFNSEIGTVYALHVNGTERWRSNITGPVYHSGVVAPDGRYIVVDRSGTVHAFEGANGTRAWTYDTNLSTIYTPPMTISTRGSDAYRVVVSAAAELLELRPNGTLHMAHTYGNANFHSLNTNPEGQIFVVTDNGEVLSIHPAGNVHWNFSAESRSAYANYAATLWDSGTFYFGGGDGLLYAINATTGQLRYIFPTGDQLFSHPAASPMGDVVYVASWDGYLYAIY
ncbi:uncharacterized protein MONBRDRAFT_8484 [Monosiga brevicollis MX1]|uniref:Pyrrolo-quinoline quinone repeat domain-containing protein n=1 Tax=Monosiga brevicollis TaxID=81824 RepID=A9V063_MONBE|nr:uncharacterized protein MONBRDRAFT_8484 [Monosiga brevicollis MX1]EDQ89102.1 predicted protein [Monosiga brevicollis MX1]|eukprot:XP_001746207.1 hypothetical protein [Monosiga brevicollis MX1]